MLALADSPQHPAQFVFDRSQLVPRAETSEGAVLAFVISLCQLPPRELEAAVLQQAKTQLGLDLQAVQTVVEKRATIAATPAAFAAKAQMPACLGQGLYLAGDYLHAAYPSTLEGAVQSAQAAVAALLSDVEP
jgi:hypothetical protein